MTWLKSPNLKGQAFSWLTEEGSLTDRLKKEFHDVKVVVVYEGIFPSDSKYYSREVILESNNTPRIFARTLVKEIDLEGAWNSLKNLGDQSLAIILFNSPEIKKVSVVYRELFLDDALLKHVNLFAPIRKRSLWARKSSWEKEAAVLDLIEIFL